MDADMPVRHFVKYTFLKADPAWRRLDDDRRAADKREFIAACEDFAEGHLLRAFSLVGTRGDADLMLLSQAQNLERIHEFHVVLAQSGLMKWSTAPYSFLAMTKPSEYSEESRLEIRPAHGKYLFVYPRSEERRVGKECRSRWSAYHSSRRRHTRYWRDWSSDVCSSDLAQPGTESRANPRIPRRPGAERADEVVYGAVLLSRDDQAIGVLGGVPSGDTTGAWEVLVRLPQIGRASCRERV